MGVSFCTCPLRSYWIAGFMCKESLDLQKDYALRKKCPYSELFWSAFSLIWTDMERYGVSLRIQSKCEKILTRITPNTELFTQWRLLIHENPILKKYNIFTLFLRVYPFSKRSSRPQVFCKKGALRNFAKFKGKHLCQSLL